MGERRRSLEGMAEMRILVTGSQGYIGTILCALLKDRGHCVMGLDSDLYRFCTFGPTMPDIPFVCKDIRDAELRDVEGYDVVMHLAGLSNDPLGDLNPDLTYEINHRASVRLAQLCKDAGVPRFIFSSSCSNYGAGGDAMLNEESQFSPVTPYGVSKVLVERDVSQMADDKYCPVFLRNATAYGVSPRLRFDLVLNNLVAWAYTTGKIMMKSDGSPWRPIVHIEDISLAFAVTAEAPQELVHNKAFNVGVTSDNLQIREIAKIVGQTVPKCEVAFASGASPDKRNYRVNCDRIRQILPAFKPKWDARLGAQELYQAYKKHGVTLEEFEGVRYQRIGHIKHLISSGQIDEKLRWKK